MAGPVLLLVAVSTALLAGLSARLAGLVATLLVSYLAFVAELALLTLILSPVREVTEGGLAAAQALLLAGALGYWWRRGRPRPSFAAAGSTLAGLLGDPVTALFLVAVGLVLGYELLLGLTVPPNNWDSLTYHLARVASWLHHGGIYWIPNAPTDRMNEFQPVAEQQILYLFAATGSTRLYALPQFLAELALLLTVYGSARRLGFGARPAACSAFLFATFGLIAYEATTAQNDLVAASMPAVAAYLLLGSDRIEAFLAGIAAGIGAGVKLTTVLVWPILVWLALLRGRKGLLVAAAGAVLGLVAIGEWGFVLNAVHTGHLLGRGGGRVEESASPSFPGSLVTGLSTVYLMMDISTLSPRLVEIVTGAAALIAAIALWRSFRSVGVRRGAARAARIAFPFFAPALVVGGAIVLGFLTRALGSPVRGPGGSYSTETGTFGGINATADESYSAFGPVGGVVLIAVPVVTAVSYYLHKVDVRHLALALALPVFVLGLALQSKFDPFLTRFTIVAAALTAPLLARLFASRATTAAFVLMSTAVIVLGITRLETKKLFSSLGPPWSLTEAQALLEEQQPSASRGYTTYERLVPAGACVGALLGIDDPAYLLGGPDLRRAVYYLPQRGSFAAAEADQLAYVVIKNEGSQRLAAALFRHEGWRISRLGGYWLLATAPHPGGKACA